MNNKRKGLSLHSRGNYGHSFKNIINLRFGRAYVLHVVTSQSQQAKPILFTLKKDCEK